MTHPGHPPASDEHALRGSIVEPTIAESTRGAGPEFAPLPPSDDNFTADLGGVPLGAGHAAGGRGRMRQRQALDLGDDAVGATGANSVPVCRTRFGGGHADTESIPEPADDAAAVPRHTALGDNLITSIVLPPHAALDVPATTDVSPRESWRPQYTLLPFPETMRTWPSSASEHLVVEKTARRVAMQPQLEVMLRLRQDGVASFNFINPDNELHSYYRHLVARASRELADTSSEFDWPAAVRVVDAQVAGDAEARLDNVEGDRHHSEPVSSPHDGRADALIATDAPSSSKPSRPSLVAYNALGISYDSDSEGQSSTSSEAPPEPPDSVALAAAAASAIAARLDAARAAALVAAAALDASSRIQPAPATLEVMEKLIVHACRGGGRRFVMLVAERERSNATFAFLQQWNTHHAFFERRLGEELRKAGLEPVDDNEVAGVDNTGVTTSPAPVPGALEMRPRPAISVTLKKSTTAVASRLLEAKPRDAVIPPGPQLHTVTLRHPLLPPRAAGSASAAANDDAVFSGSEADSHTAPISLHCVVQKPAADTASATVETSATTHVSSCADAASTTLAVPVAVPLQPVNAADAATISTVSELPSVPASADEDVPFPVPAPAPVAHPQRQAGGRPPAQPEREYITSFEAPPPVSNVRWQPQCLAPTVKAPPLAPAGYDSDDALDSDAGVQAWDSPEDRAAFFAGTTSVVRHA